MLLVLLTITKHGLFKNDTLLGIIGYLLHILSAKVHFLHKYIIYILIYKIKFKLLAGQYARQKMPVDNVT